ncbi:MAG: helix-turn-helix domain-containing protein [Oscillospiraceae bacterium]|nr:helix-turn-helix domain-containing protein [Oscillospiraceae bacterium]
MITLQENLKALRRAKDLTQEQLAEICGVSPQAVSRWETGAACPDIALLPELANCFGITVDELLGAGQARREALIQGHLQEFDEALNRGLVMDAVELSRAAVREFPTDWRLQNQLMYALFVATSDDGDVPGWEENQKKYDAEIVALGEKIAQYCPDDDLRLEAKARLAFHYCETGRKQQALPLIESLPSEESCRESYRYWALEGEERLALVETRMRSGLGRLAWGIRAWVANGGAKTPGDRIAWREKLNQCVAIVLGGDLGDWHEMLAKVAAANARDAMEMGQPAQALAYLAKAAEHADAYHNDKPCHSADSRPLGQILLEEYCVRECFDALRENGEFLALCGRLRAAAPTA